MRVTIVIEAYVDTESSDGVPYSHYAKTRNAVRNGVEAALEYGSDEGTLNRWLPEDCSVIIDEVNIDD